LQDSDGAFLVANIVKPIVRLFFACDEAILDLTDGKWTLKNPWHTVAMPLGITGNFCQEEMWLYAQVVGGVGTFRFTVELRDEAGLVVGRSKPSEERDLSGGNAVFEEVFHLTRVPFDKPGNYEFKLLGNHAELEGGTAYLRVLSGGAP
jgi:hypothetical protein